MDRLQRHPRNGRLLASVLGAIGVTLWATETTLINLVPNIPPLQVVALAFAFAATMMPIVWKLTGESPLLAFRLPKRVWLLMVTALVGYHSCIYYATQKAPPAAAALLQGTTPLLIVLGSALLPGERLRWWHVGGALLGFAGIVFLINVGQDVDSTFENSVLYLSIIGVAAALWGLYSVVARTLSDVPTSALGMFYAASSVVALVAHLLFETWVMPTAGEWLAIAGLGFLPMGIAIYLWDYGLKRGDIQALGAFSYTEPFIGAVLVAVVTHATLSINLLWSGALITAGAILASASLWQAAPAIAATVPDAAPPNPSTLADLQDAVARLGGKILDALEHESALTPDERRQLERLLVVAERLWGELEAAGIGTGALAADYALAA